MGYIQGEKISRLGYEIDVGPKNTVHGKLQCSCVIFSSAKTANQKNNQSVKKCGFGYLFYAVLVCGTQYYKLYAGEEMSIAAGDVKKEARRKNKNCSDLIAFRVMVGHSFVRFLTSRGLQEEEQKAKKGKREEMKETARISRQEKADVYLPS